MRILVTGATGFLGRHLVPLLENENEVYSVSSQDFDLTNLDSTYACFQQARPEVVYHLAGLSGGIGANLEEPAKFYFVNTLLIANIFQAACDLKIKRLIVPMGGCSYPATAVSPIGEDQMWNGYPHETSAAYSSAKKMAIVASQAYKKQGLKSTVVVPGNMYGEFDNFSLSASHVIPAIVRKVYEAKMSNSNIIEMWGSGKPVRDFVYAGDVATVMKELLERDDLYGPINISTGTSITIRQVTDIVMKQLDFRGEVVWNSSKPEGQLVKVFDVSTLKELGYECPTPIETGIAKTTSWFESNYSNPGKVRL
jgi:GDP-L-fucose synthase